MAKLGGLSKKVHTLGGNSLHTARQGARQRHLNCIADLSKSHATHFTQKGVISTASDTSRNQ